MKKLLIVILAAVLCLLPVSTAFADFGSYSGSTDFSYDDFDFGGSYDYGSDYSGYDYYGDYGTSSGGGIWEFSIGAIVVLIVIVMSILKKRKAGSGSNTNGMPISPVRNGNLRPMAEYLTIDPEFDATAFSEKLGNLYVQMQNCWTDRDISSLRPYFTDAMFTQMERQLTQMEKNGQTNYVERIAVMNVNLDGFTSDGKEDRVTATLNTRIVDYTLEDSTGRLIAGDRNAEKFMCYEWTLSRAAGMTTGSAAAMDKTVCPSCGAPLDINTSARCPYCGSVITMKEHDWAICAIRAISQRTR